MKTSAFLTSLKHVFLSAIAASSLFSASHAYCQVNGAGPSAPNLFDNVINIPTDPDIGDSQSFGGVAEETTQINLFDGGTIGSRANFNSGVELNMTGGILRFLGEANAGSEVNISGGTVLNIFDIRGAETDISGGFFEGSVRFGGGSEPTPNNLSLSGGVFGFEFSLSDSIFTGPSNAEITGGRFRDRFNVSNVGNPASGTAPNGNFELLGGDFQVNGTAFNQPDLFLAEGDVFSGTLQDGSAFIFSSRTADSINGLTLRTVPLPQADTDPIVVTTPQADSSIRSGETLFLQDGGELEFFRSVDSTLNIEGGRFARGEVSGSTVNISGGNAGDAGGAEGIISFFSDINVSGGTSRVVAYSSQINVSGGTAIVNARSDAVVNISGGVTDFSASAGSVFNIDGGSIFGGAGSNSIVNIGEGTHVALLRTFSNSEVNISGGNFTDSFRPVTDSDIRISGGTFETLIGGNLDLIGGDFKLNGNAFSGAIINNLSSEDVFTGTFQNGSSFIFSPLAGTTLSNVTLSSDGLLPSIDTTPIVVDTVASLPGLREGQTLMLLEGGELTNFRSVGGTLNMDGGILGTLALATDSVINISGGSVKNNFKAFLGSEVNVSGGIIGGGTTGGGSTAERSEVYDSTLNITGGTFAELLLSERSTVIISGGVLERSFDASDSTVNISAGANVRNLEAQSGSTANISGGLINVIRAEAGSEIFITGGNIKGFRADDDSFVRINGGTFGDVGFANGDVELSGGEFQLNGVDFNESTISLDAGDVFTGTLEDGSVFIFADEFENSLVDVRLTQIGLPAANTTPIVVNSPMSNAPPGLRAGQTLTLESGGIIEGTFDAVGAVINVNGGSFEGDTSFVNTTINLNDGALAGETASIMGSEINLLGGIIDGLVPGSGSVINIHGGIYEDRLSANAGSEINLFDEIIDGLVAGSGSVINIHGGIIEVGLSARADSVVDLFATEFFIDGEGVDFPNFDTPIVIDNREFLLSGSFSDGTEFEYVVGSRGDFSVSSEATFQLNLASGPRPICGDVNLDGEVNFLDISPFITVLASGDFQAEADCHANDVVNFLDIAPFIAALIGP